MSNAFIDEGPSDDHVRVPTMPAYIEVTPDSFKPLDACDRAEIEAKIISLTIEAQALMDEAKTLNRYLDRRQFGFA